MLSSMPSDSRVRRGRSRCSAKKGTAIPRVPHTTGVNYCGPDLILSANNRLYTPQLQVNEPPDGPEKRRAHCDTERGRLDHLPNPPTRARRDAHRRARTHARTRRTRRKCTGQHRRVCLRAPTLVATFAEAKEIYRANRAGTEAVYRLDQSDRISCTASVKPLGSSGANSTSCIVYG